MLTKLGFLSFKLLFIEIQSKRIYVNRKEEKKGKTRNPSIHKQQKLRSTFNFQIKYKKNGCLRYFTTRVHSKRNTHEKTHKAKCFVYFYTSYEHNLSCSRACTSNSDQPLYMYLYA